MGRLDNKVAIITGSAMGMGKEVAKLFSKEGATVAVTDLDREEGIKTTEEINHQHAGKAHFWELNVSSEENVRNVYKEVVDKWGKIDIIVNNAGVTGVDKETHEVTEEEWDQVFSVDVKGVFFSTKHAVPYMKENGGGSIVNFSSIYGLVGSPEIAPYHAAKGAVTIMTKKDAVTYGKDGIRVNSVHPGTTLTPLVQKLADEKPGYKEEMEAKHPIGYLGQPIDIAYGVLFLASDEGRFVTGAQLVIDGGYTAQ